MEGPGEDLGQVEGLADRRRDGVQRRELVVLIQNLLLQQAFFAEIAEVNEDEASLIEADADALDLHRDDARFLRLHRKVVIGEALFLPELLEVLHGPLAVSPRVQIFDTAVEELAALVSGEKLRRPVRFEAQAVGGVEEERGNGSALEGGTVLPARLRSRSRQGLELRLGHSDASRRGSEGGSRLFPIAYGS